MRADLKKRNQVYVQTYKEEHPCVVCNESDPVVLHFHHRDSREKKCRIADLVNGASAIATIQQEIDKCVVLCANCHMRVHAGTVILVP